MNPFGIFIEREGLRTREETQAKEAQAKEAQTGFTGGRSGKEGEGKARGNREQQQNRD